MLYNYKIVSTREYLEKAKRKLIKNLTANGGESSGIDAKNILNQQETTNYLSFSHTHNLT